MNYSEQKSWKELEKFLPQKLHFNSNYHPEEEWWNWKGNNVHLEIQKQRQKLFYFTE